MKCMSLPQRAPPERCIEIPKKKCPTFSIFFHYFPILVVSTCARYEFAVSEAVIWQLPPGRVKTFKGSTVLPTWLTGSGGDAQIHDAFHDWLPEMAQNSWIGRAPIYIKNNYTELGMLHSWTIRFVRSVIKYWPGLANLRICRGVIWAQCPLIV